MRDCEFWRLVEEICFLLGLNQPSTHQVVEFYRKLAASETHTFRPEVVIAACIFLVSKVQEHEHKIRDILNICYVVTTLYKRANQQKGTEEIEYIHFGLLRYTLQGPALDEIIPSFSLERVTHRPLSTTNSRSSSSRPNSTCSECSATTSPAPRPPTTSCSSAICTTSSVQPFLSSPLRTL